MPCIDYDEAERLAEEAHEREWAEYQEWLNVYTTIKEDEKRDS